jgi:hypothetical protein
MTPANASSWDFHQQLYLALRLNRWRLGARLLGGSSVRWLLSIAANWMDLCHGNSSGAPTTPACSC